MSGRRFVFTKPPRFASTAPAASQSHASGLAIVASDNEKKKSDDPKKLARTSAEDVEDARLWLERIGATDALAMFNASIGDAGSSKK